MCIILVGASQPSQVPNCSIASTTWTAYITEGPPPISTATSSLLGPL